jgi:hypothetical protein
VQKGRNIADYATILTIVLFLCCIHSQVYKDNLRTNLDKQGKWSDVIGFDLAETFTRPALECFYHVSVNI